MSEMKAKIDRLASKFSQETFIALRDIALELNAEVERLENKIKEHWNF